MKIHKGGYKLIFYTISTVIIILLILHLLWGQSFGIITKTIISIISGYIMFSVVYFFRYPNRKNKLDKNTVYAAADGKICCLEKVKEETYFKSERLMISTYMDITNVHVNWVPVSGTVSWCYHQDGQNYPAYNPKSSLLNERCSTVIKLDSGEEVMVVQIAGLIARRIVNNFKENDKATQGDELGIIKLGSRVDVFLPPEAKPKVKIGQKVRAMKNIIATFE